MKSYTNMRNLYGTLTKNTSTANLTLGDETMMDEYRHMCGMKDFAFLHRLRTLSTVASTQFLNMPYDVDTVESVSIVVGSTRYTPRLIKDRDTWDRLNMTSFTSDIPVYAYVYAGQLGLWPTPATSANIITLNVRVRVVDLNTADITSSTIATLTNGATAITLSGGLTAQMPGFWIKPTFSTTANTGDGRWYEISGVTNSTTGTLVRAYGGNSIVAGTAASVIAQVPLLPEEFHDTPVYFAAAQYWYKEADSKRADSYISKYKKDIEILETQRTAEISDLVLNEGIVDDGIINPNLTINL